MVEMIAAVSIVSSIVQFISFGAGVLERLNDFKSSINDVPKVFRDIKIELPLLLDTLEKTKEQAELGTITPDTQKALLPVIDGCSNQVKLLDNMINRVLTTSEDSSWQKGRKALTRIVVEKKSQIIIDMLRGYVQILTYYQAVSIAGSVKGLDSYKEPEPVFTVPFERDPGFIDRPEITSKLDMMLETRHSAALAGIGGVGKTQIAIEYCYRYRERDPLVHVFWVHASTASRFDQAYKHIARTLNLAGWDALSLNTVEIVSEWLNGHGRWLLVFDNADDVDLFFGPSTMAGQQKQMYEYLPRREDSAIIITTRDKRVAYRLTDKEDPIIVLPMSVNDAASLLRSKAAHDQAPNLSTTEGSELLEALGNLPLAITQAAAFMTENNITASEYLEVLRTNQSEVEDLLSEEIGDRRRYSESGSSILNTLKLSFDQIAKQNPLAADILSFMAFLDRNGIPRSLIKKNSVRTIDFVSALGTLQAFSLIEAKKGEASFQMHRLVQLSLQRWLRNSRSKWQDEVLEVLSEKFPLGDFNNWKECEMLSPHAHMAINYPDFSDVSKLRRAKILHNLARFDSEQSRYELAEKRYTEAVAIREKLLGVDSPDTLKSMSNLGEVLFREDKYAQAEPVFRQVIAESEKLFGPKSEEALYNTGLLAEVVHGWSRLAEAEVLFRKALEGDGDTLPDVLTMKIADNLGAVLRDEKKYDESEIWIRKSLVGRERLLGPTHPETLRSVNHLALLLSLMDRLDEAELMARRAMAGSEMTRGRYYHLTLMSTHTLGKILCCKGQYEPAAELCRRVLNGCLKVLGPSNRETLRCLQSLGLIEEGQGKYVEAEVLLVQVVNGNLKALGQEHHETLSSMKDLERVRVAREMQATSL